MSTPAAAAAERAGAVGWDDPRTAMYYEAFCEAHGRYAEANAALVANAALAPGQRVLDVAAGSGRTATAALALLGAGGRVTCVEPARAMREAGRARLAGEARVRWRASLPPASGTFDRVLCGAAIWQLSPLRRTIRMLARRLAPGGALAFNIPALYLGEPDEAGGGADPMLTGLVARLAEGRTPLSPRTAAWRHDARDVQAVLVEVGLVPFRWHFRVRLTQAALRDWLKIPVLTDAILHDVQPAERARRLDAAYDAGDAASWRWERWTGWTAWRPR